MDEFLHRENLALFRRKLAETKDAATRTVILQLIAEEEARPPSPPLPKQR